MAKGKKTGGGPLFQPGNTLGKGRPPVPEDLKAAREVLRGDFERTAHKVMGMTQVELNAFIKDPKTTALELVVAGIIGKALSKGDQTRLGFILDRVVGPITKKIQMEGASESDAPTAPVKALSADDVTSTLITLQKLIQKKEESECKSMQNSPQPSELPVPCSPAESAMESSKKKSDALKGS